MKCPKLLTFKNKEVKRINTKQINQSINKNKNKNKRGANLYKWRYI
jgi:hypothetical protein